VILWLIAGAECRVMMSFAGDLVDIAAMTCSGPLDINRTVSRCAWCLCRVSNIEQVVPDMTLLVRLAILYSVKCIDIKEYQAATGRSFKEKVEKLGQILNAARIEMKLET
jgi:hypothetical protein